MQPIEPSTRRDLTVDEIVRRGGAIVRSEGDDALTMRRLARACGVTPMALYHHVADKDDIIDRILDEVAGEVLAVTLDGPAPERLLGFTEGAYRIMTANPGVGRLWATRGITVPNMALITERFFELIADCGVEGKTAAAALDALVLYLIGGIAYSLSRPPGIRKDLLVSVDAERAPRLAGVIDSYSERDPDQRFRWGLERLWKGIVAGEAAE